VTSFRSNVTVVNNRRNGKLGRAPKAISDGSSN
jgi:hypothetical protein